MQPVIVATCNLNQWAMDFHANLRRIKASISKARKQHATYRLGPELEITGYACEDHFLEPDTFTHTWQSIAELISEGYTDHILVDIGAPVLHRHVPYNARIFILNREILLIRPKLDLADYGNYREPRWFRAWNRKRPLEQFFIPPELQSVCRNKDPHCPIGFAIIETFDGITVAAESCEELWTLNAAHIPLTLAGVDIIGNGSGSHHNLRKLDVRVDLLRSATRKAGGIYLYSNQIGCDGGRLYYDGSALIVLNGDILRQGSQFTIETEVEVITAVVDVADVHAYRSRASSITIQAAETQIHNPVPRIRPTTPFSLSVDRNLYPVMARVQELSTFTVEEEIAKGPACWLWDYLRRSGMNGFFVPLSGGADSSSTAAIVGSMCQLIVTALAREDCESQLLDDVRRVTNSEPDYVPSDAKELASRLFCTVYMGSQGVSSPSTRDRAGKIAEEIGSWHHNIDISVVVQTFLRVFGAVFGKVPKFAANGGSPAENLALQNVQARVRMVFSYLFAQLTLWAQGRKGSLLVLGSSNVDEALRGYLTKYDCSAADINPIGGISKTDLRAFLKWAATPEGLGYPSLHDVVRAPPSAELEPIVNGRSQTDEADMGMTYDELSWFGKLRKQQRCGPFSMYLKLKDLWASTYSVEEIAHKVKFFFRMYSINRHKITTLTPSYHAEDYSPEDNRFDLRQFLYNTKWTFQFRKIDEDLSPHSPS